MEKTDPIRWVCPICLRVSHRPLVLYVPAPGQHKYTVGKIRLVEPFCNKCRTGLLLAGEPKKDVHGLHDLDAMIDPVDNLKRG